MKSFIIALFSFFAFEGFAADRHPYDWEANRKQYILTDEERASSEIVLKEHVEYAYVFENDQFVMYDVFHRIVRVNNSEAIQRHNRIKISMERTIELVDLKGRVIGADNKITNFDKNNLKELKDEEGGAGYRIFAMEGVENGSEVEYFFIRKLTPVIFGRVYFQKDVRVKESSFVMSAPKNLEFEFRSYNGMPEVTIGDATEKNEYKVLANNIEPINDEEFGYSDAWGKRIEYKLNYNKAKSKEKLYTWDYAGKQFYAMLSSLTKDEEKSLEKFAKNLPFDPSKKQQQNIRAIERQIKTSIQVNDEANDEPLNDLSAIIKYKVASQKGITKLFLNTFVALKIPVQLVLTCDRRYRHFDDKFDSWNYLNDYLLYFPEAQTFLSPYNSALISPLIDPQFTGHKGLFIEPIQIGGLKSALASVQEIPATPWNYNTDNLDITIVFNTDLSGNEVAIKRDFNGHGASFIAPYYHLMSEEQKQKMAEELMKTTAPGLTVNKWVAQTNFDGEVDRFTLDVNFSTAHFIERAGPQILFKVGLAIGPQSELYQNDKRMLPVENFSQRGYERTIKVTIPDGYAIKNADDLKFNVLYKDQDKIPFSFVSDYVIDGQTLTIKVDEYYKDLYAPLERYEDFRNVINAAADFNKVTLVLEKKR